MNPRTKTRIVRGLRARNRLLDDEAADLIEELESRNIKLEKVLWRVHKYAIRRWNEGKEDGWLWVMRECDPTTIAEDE